MLLKIYWSLSLLFVASTAALSSSSSLHHSTSITKTSVSSVSSIQHTSLSTTKKSSTPISSTPHTSSSSTKSSATAVPSTFYLVAADLPADTGQTALDGSYFKIIIDPYPTITISGDSALQIAGKTSAGAANFTLNTDGTLQCNTASGPLVACVANGHPETQTFMFEAPADLGKSGFVTDTCAIASGALNCTWGPLVDFLLTPSNVVNETQTGEIVKLALPEDGTQFTILVVPT